jgi:release factor glutamine methyltransferase
MTVREAIANALAAEVSRRDAEVLLAHVLRRERVWLLAHFDDDVAAEELITLQALCARRAATEPLQHLTGTQEFYGLSLRVTRDTLIPRPETELLVEAVQLWALPFHDERTLRIADVGTGSGAIAVALATHLAGVAVVAIDNSAATLEVARGNAHAHGCEERVEFVLNDLLVGMAAQSFDAVVSNPPYVALADAATLAVEVREHEPHGALFGGEDGLAVYARLVPQAELVLRAGGLLAMEIGFGQSAAVRALLEINPGAWRDVRVVDDYAEIPRVVLAERGGEA